MRVCPTNVIHPAGLEAGLEGLWTPKLNFRIGTSGCQHTCIACGHLCPTAAIRPISLDERRGAARLPAAARIRIGTAFVDRGRCLPWAMDRPCIVCQENCPVSPKAIFTREVFNAVRTSAPLTVKSADRSRLTLTADTLEPGRFGTGDYHALLPGGLRLRITANTAGALELERPLAGAEAPCARQPGVDPGPAAAALRGPEAVHRLRRLRARMPGARPARHPGDGRERVAQAAPPDGALRWK